jgi:Predicted thioesterase involved in non-ribosomal peptide biosynthesis
MKLLCLPYAGGTAQVFKNLFKTCLDASIEIVPIELPGRGNRFSEALKTDFNELLEDILKKVLDVIQDEAEYALFGYSMGSRVIFEIYYSLLKYNVKKPKIMFFCAAKPPEIHYVKKKMDRFSIIREMKELGGTKEEVLENEQLMDIFVPIMGADMQVLFSYNYILKNAKISVPIVILYGTKDTEVLPYIDKWRNYTDKECEFIAYNDGHFFINKYYKDMAKEINVRLVYR